MPRVSVFDFWFRPKAFEAEGLYKRLGALVIKRYVPTGGDVVMRHLRRRYPRARLVTSSLRSLCTYERRTRVSEAVHLMGFTAFTVLIVVRLTSGSLSILGFSVALAVNLILGLWPAILQRYNRLRLYRIIYGHSRLPG